MADLIGQQLTGGNELTQSEQLVEAYRAQEQSKIDRYILRENELSTKRNFYNKLNSTMSSLQSQIDTMEYDSAIDKFFAKKVTSTDADVITASGDKDAVIGTNQIKVNQIATNDILISNRVNLEDSPALNKDSYTFEIGSGDEKFEITVDVEDDDSYEELMVKITKAVNNTEDINVSASYIKDTPTTGRLTFTSEETGSNNTITFSNSSLLNKFGINESINKASQGGRVLYGDDTAGYRNSSTDELDSKLQVNGISVVRNSNSIDDLIPGLELTINKAQEEDDPEILLKSSVDRTAVEEFIRPFLESYNSMLEHLRSNTSIKRSESGISSLYSNLRGISSSKIGGLEEGNPSYISEAGIRIANDGKLYIEDFEELEDLLEDDPQKLYDLFLSEDGFVNKIKQITENLTGSSGVIQSRTKSLNEQIDTNSKRRSEQQSRIDEAAEAYRREYEALLEVQLNMQAQYNSYYNLLNGYY